jgi:phenylacetic acid degradation operon negative regulatory protein
MDVVNQLINEFSGQSRIRAGSLIISVYGDAIAPRGGGIWLGSLIDILGHLGVNQRLVRTSVFRLVRDRWLVARQVGRRSFYSLTESGRREFETASRRIYSGPRDDWQDNWWVLLVGAMDARPREALARALKWQGFGVLAPAVLAHPQPDREVLHALLEEHDVDEVVITLQARTGDLPMARQPQQLRSIGWDLSELAGSYDQFLERYRPVFTAVRRQLPGEREAFLVRTLLIHDYRRVLLRDPRLPAALLPADWPGLAAYALCRNLYRLLWAPAEHWLSTHMETAEGPLPAPAPYFHARFGGLHED